MERQQKAATRGAQQGGPPEVQPKTLTPGSHPLQVRGTYPTCSDPWMANPSEALTVQTASGALA